MFDNNLYLADKNMHLVTKYSSQYWTIDNNWILHQIWNIGLENVICLWNSMSKSIITNIQMLLTQLQSLHHVDFLVL